MAEKVVVQLVLDTSRYNKGATSAAQSTAKIQTATDKTAGSMGKLQQTAGKLGLALGAAFAAKAALNFAKSSIAAFSNLEESVNAVEVSFGDAAKGVLALGANSAEQFGLSTRAVNDAAVAMSAFASKIDEADPADAFENVLQRATDFASVMNIDVEESLLLFRSGLAGESEPLRKFGIDVSAATVNLVGLEAGLGGANGKLSEGEKVQARYLAIMQQTEKTAGDFANTSEGLANSQRILSAKWEEAQATLGKQLAPAMTKLLKAGTDLIPVFGILVKVVGGFLDTIGPGIDILGKFATVLGELSEQADASAESGGFMAGVWENLADTAIQLIPDIGAAKDAVDAVSLAFTHAEPPARELVDTLDLMAARERRAAEEALALAGLLPIVTSTSDDAEDATSRLGVAAQTAAERFQAQADAMRDVVRAAAEAASPILRAIRAQEGKTKADLNLIKVNEDVEASDADRLEAILAVIEAQVDLDVANATLIGSIEGAREAFFAEGEAAGFTRDEIQKLFDLVGTFPTTVPIDFVFSTSGQFERVEQLLGGGGSFGGGVKLMRHGGRVAADEPFIVGEGGPELFIPDQAGRIIPNKGFGEQSIVVNVNDSTTTDLAADLSAGLIAAQITQQVEMLRI